MSTGRRWQVSSDGGWEPRWLPDGSALVYAAPGSRLMSAEVHGGDAPEVGAPELLLSMKGGQLCDVAPDERFLVSVPLEDSNRAPLSVVLGWTSLLPSR